jgi:hypothetical protein
MAVRRVAILGAVVKPGPDGLGGGRPFCVDERLGAVRGRAGVELVFGRAHAPGYLADFGQKCDPAPLTLGMILIIVCA